MSDRFDAVLFDLDGTLLDSVALIVLSYRHTLAAYGLPEQSDAEILSGLGTTLEAQLSRWAPGDARIPEMIDTYRAHNLAHHDRMVRGYPGVSEIVRSLHGTSKLAIVTSKRRDGTERGVRALELEHCFAHLVCADDVERAKPHPEPVHRALSLLGADPSRTLFVGDSPYDMLAGRAAGVRTAAVLWGPFTRRALAPSGPDVFVSEASELAALVL